MIHIARGRIYFMVSDRDPYSILLLGTHLCDLFYFLEDLHIASHVDDTTIYAANE